MAKLIIVRGLPGSGKSTYAKQIKKVRAVVEIEMYFTTPAGDYHFNLSKLQDAHHWCQELVRSFLAVRRPVVVANIFSRKWEIDHYLRIAEDLKVPVEIHKCVGSFTNIHGIPKTTIQAMRERWEDMPGEIVIDPTAVQWERTENDGAVPA